MVGISVRLKLLTLVVLLGAYIAMAQSSTDEEELREAVRNIVLLAIPGIVMFLISLLYGIFYCLARTISMGKVRKYRNGGCCRGSCGCSSGVVNLVILAVLGWFVIIACIYGLTVNTQVSEGLDEFTDTSLEITRTAQEAIARTDALSELQGITSPEMNDVTKTIQDLSSTIDDINSQNEKVHDAVMQINVYRETAMKISMITPMVALVILILAIFFCLRFLFNGFLFVLWVAVIFFWLSFGIQLPTTHTVEGVCKIAKVAQDPESQLFQDLVAETPPQVQSFIGSCVETNSFLTALNPLLNEVLLNIDTIDTQSQQTLDYLKAFPDANSPTTDIAATIQNIVTLRGMIQNASATNSTLQFSSEQIKATLENLSGAAQEVAQIAGVAQKTVSAIPPIVFGGKDKKEQAEKMLSDIALYSGDLNILIDTALAVNEVISCTIIKSQISTLVTSLCDPLENAIRTLTWVCFAVALSLTLYPFFACVEFGGRLYQREHGNLEKAYAPKDDGSKQEQVQMVSNV